MTSKLKALGIALVASLALSAVVVSAAQATYAFTAPEGPISLTGSQTTQNILTTTGGEVKCNTAEFTGTKTSASGSELLLAPHYSGCTAFGLTAHVNATACTYLFDTPTTALSVSEYRGLVPRFQCPAGNITVTPTIFGASVCTLTIEEQTPTSGNVVYRNEGAGTTRDIRVTFNLEGIHYNSSGGPCGEVGKTYADGKYTGSMTLKGFKHNLAHTTANHRAISIN